MPDEILEQDGPITQEDLDDVLKGLFDKTTDPTHAAKFVWEPEDMGYAERDIYPEESFALARRATKGFEETLTDEQRKQLEEMK